MGENNLRQLAQRFLKDQGQPMPPTKVLPFRAQQEFELT